MYQEGDMINQKYRVLRMEETSEQFNTYLVIDEAKNLLYSVREYPLTGVSEPQKRELISSISALNDVNHQLIVCPFEIVENDHSLLVIRETLVRVKLSVDNPPELDCIRNWFEYLCDALGYLQAKASIIPRVLTPENVLLHPDINAYLVDFETSLNNVLYDTMLKTKPDVFNYMAPELRSGGDSYDQRACIYSLGAVMYYLICGHAPKLTPEPLDSCQRYDAWVFCSLRVIIEKCMMQDPAQRYQSFAELMYDFDPEVNPYYSNVQPIHSPLDIIRIRRRKRLYEKYKKKYIADYSFLDSWLTKKSFPRR